MPVLHELSALQKVSALLELSALHEVSALLELSVLHEVSALLEYLFYVKSLLRIKYRFCEKSLFCRNIGLAEIPAFYEVSIPSLKYKYIVTGESAFSNRI